MTRWITELSGIADRFDAVVLDQWGVLHDGSAPYPGAVEAVTALGQAGARLAVLSNSGKRAASNAERIADIGFPRGVFETVMTSGEALWRDLRDGVVTARHLYAIERAPGDAAAFLDGLGDVTAVDGIKEADAVLLMGVPDGAEPGRFDAVLREAHDAGLPVLCTNPDRASPRAGGRQVMSPGALAQDHVDRGGSVRFYGKPHEPVFRAVETALGCAPERLLMVGDSLEHDIAGAVSAGWSSAFVRGGLHATAFAGGQESDAALVRLAWEERAPLPDFTLATIGACHA